MILFSTSLKNIGRGEIIIMFFQKSVSNSSTDNHNDKTDFIAALADFSLVHTELISLQATLRVQEISQKASELTSTSQNMAAMTEEVSASVQQINAAIQQVTAGAQETVSKINKLAELGNETETMLKDMMNNVGELSAQVKHIDNISQNVSEIADQTNLLALNAAIEAARAGDAGRGFNVVAEEVRKLAGQTKEAVGNVKQISDQMSIKSSTTNSNILKVQDIFKQYLDNSNIVGDIIRDSTKQTEECAGMVENITSAMQEQTVIAEKLTNVSEEQTKTCEFIIGLLRNEADDLSKIVAPVLKISDNESIINVLAARLKDHANFLRKTMAEAGKGLKVLDYHECAFGKWYDANKSKYNHIEAFIEVDEPHRKVHEAGRMLSQELTSKNVENLMYASADILKAFIKLYDVFNKKS